jgi:hypothetical protein
LSLEQALRQQIADVKIALTSSFLANPASTNIDAIKTQQAGLASSCTKTDQIDRNTAVNEPTKLNSKKLHHF